MLRCLETPFSVNRNPKIAYHKLMGLLDLSERTTVA